jgi:hypothetical protein
VAIADIGKLFPPVPVVPARIGFFAFFMSFREVQGYFFEAWVK